VLPAGYEARVLEPSPPASTDPAWYADDPTDPADAEMKIVTPIPGEGITWDAMAEAHPPLDGYAWDHWLSARRRLRPLPAGYTATRHSLHQLAFFALAPKRHAATGKLGLRYTHHGFGTPFFGDDEQIRLEAGVLVYQGRDGVRCSPLTTVGAACDFLGIPYRESWFGGFHDPPEPVGPAACLAADEEAAEAVGDWFGFATLVLEQLRRIPTAGEVTRVQLWPEHFDAAVEIAARGKAPGASYGASAGDANHPEPHFYVAPWRTVDRGDTYWNDPAFNGASLSYRLLLEADDPVTAALEFLTSGYNRLLPR
jgi:hypothetical protein